MRAVPMLFLCALLGGPLHGLASAAPEPSPHFGVASIGHGIVLHYAEMGSGVPVIFSHGSLSDMDYWRDQVIAFSKHYRAIAYSRRYNVPNENPPQRGYSAIVDSNDLAAFITTRRLGKAYVIGHSYGALAALYLAIRHPQLVRAVVLAEPPAIPLLTQIDGADAARGRAMYADIQRRMVLPMIREFARGDREAGVGDFMNYVLGDHAWEKMLPSARADTMKDAHEWDMIMTSGTLFPPLSAADVRRIRVPVLIMSGTTSYPFLLVIDRELARLIPGAKRASYIGAGHQMWLQQPENCRRDAEVFFRAH